MDQRPGDAVTSEPIGPIPITPIWTSDTAEHRSRLAVYAWVQDRSSVLLCRLDEEVPVGGGMWTLPGGGLDWGESPEECLHRELHEETGLAGTIDGFVGVNSRVHGPAAWRAYSIHLLAMVYRVNATGEPRVVEVDGTTAEAAWIPLADLDKTNCVSLVDFARSKISG